ncbi:calcium-binding protein [Roseomonas sp. KE2513]|uniref:calcium-binding protein n=1 Tax=Roseomonas sp. KE2513 TaxID=2479202 RepID=UPI0018E00B82|nr:calcium-binding protein [Roseomonas sp. KE2513]MBI0534966.1 calcium-binding protein [Roseomonas sp. KE2513]
MAVYNGTNGNDPLTGTIADDTFFGSLGNDTIAGGGGYNELDYRQQAYAVQLGASVTAYSGAVTKSVGGIDNFSGIHRVYGSSLDDVLSGTTDRTSGLAYAFVLSGGGGNDTINGQNNHLNLVSYSDANSGMTIDLTAGTASGGGVGNDMLIDVRRVQGSNYSDVIVGSVGNDYFDATTGIDQYDGRGGFNTVSYAGLTNVTAYVTSLVAGLYGGANLVAIKPGGEQDVLTSVNQVIGTAGDDAMIGTNAAYSYYDVVFRGGAGNDTINGFNSIFNRVDYGSATSAVTVDLQAQTAIDGQGGTDRLVLVRNVAGSNFNDTLNGSDFDDIFRVGSLGQHSVDGRGGQNTIAFTGTEAVTIDLGTTVYGSGYAGSLAKVAGADFLYNMTGAIGGAGGDTILGTPTDDLLSGGPGNNLINGRGGADTYRAGSYSAQAPDMGAIIDLGDGVNGIATNAWGGTDTLQSIENAWGTQFADTITGAVSGGYSFIRGEGGNDILRAPTAGTLIFADYLDSLAAVTVRIDLGLTLDDGWLNGQDTLINIAHARGSVFADLMLGNDLSNILMAEGGNDLVYGLGGNDLVYGGDGNDTVAAGVGDDTVVGGTGDELIFGEDGNDTLYGEAGNDLIYGGTGNDTIAGGADADIIVGEDGNDLLFGEDGNDTLYGQGGLDLIYGGAGNDVITGDADNDILIGEDGNDLLFGGIGNDVLYGGAGADHLRGDEGDDVMTGDAGIDTLVGGTGNDLIFGGDDDDTLYGEDGNDQLRGDNGNDLLIAGAGNDTLAGGAGDDVLLGDTGNDVLFGEAGNDRFVFGPNTGADTIADFGQVPGNRDVIQFQPGTLGSFGAVLAASQQVGANVVIHISVVDSVTLTNVSLASLSASDFLFA